MTTTSNRCAHPSCNCVPTLAALEEAVPAPVHSAGLYARFSSRGQDDFAGKMLPALRYQFGGHKEKPAAKKAGA